jgi:hypothetical protein
LRGEVVHGPDVAVAYAPQVYFADQKPDPDVSRPGRVSKCLSGALMAVV